MSLKIPKGSRRRQGRSILACADCPIEAVLLGTFPAQSGRFFRSKAEKFQFMAAKTLQFCRYGAEIPVQGGTRCRVT